MESSKEREELVLPLDWDIIDASNGFTFDIGGSVMKLVYVSPEDWVEPKDRKKGSQGRVRIVTFTRQEINEALAFINSKVWIRRKSKDDDTVQVFSTGIGGTEFAWKFKEQVKVRTKNLAEFDCFSHAFIHLVKNIPAQQLLYPLHKLAFKVVRRQRDQMMAVMCKMKDMTGAMDGVDIEGPAQHLVFPQEEKLWGSDELLTTEQDLYPSGIVMCGSGFGLFQVNKDGSFQLLESSHRGGRMFLGLGSLLTGAKTYSDLVDLCVSGQSNNVSITTETLRSDLRAAYEGVPEGERDDGDVYRVWMEEENMDERIEYCFGKAAGRGIDDFNSADLASCLLDTVILDLVQFSHSTAKHAGLHHVFFCGGFVDHPAVRERLFTEWLKRDAGLSIFDQKSKSFIEAHFLVHGQSLGALGAFLNHKQQWSEKTKQQAAEAVAITAEPAAKQENKDM